MLKEMQAPGAKIEDVFKRVRLNVRMQSRGQQIPWESTSLEQDFYFIPPKELRPQSLAETEPQFQEELSLWESIQSAKEPAPLEDYLRRFPSGKFSESSAAYLLEFLGEFASDTGLPIAPGLAHLGQRAGDPVG